MTAYADLPDLFVRAAAWVDKAATWAENTDPTGERWEPDKVYDESYSIWPLYLMYSDRPVSSGDGWQYPPDEGSFGGIRVNGGFADHMALWDPPPARTVARILRQMATWVAAAEERDVPTVLLGEFTQLAKELLREEADG